LVALRTLLPRRADVLPALLAFAGVCAAGYGVSFSASFFEEAPALPFFEGNMSLQAIPLVIVSSLSTGYLEEGFFRYYLFRRFHEAGVNIAAGAAVSILLFAVCHLYEGPWGVLNAALSALVLSCVFLRFRSLHAVALAHGAWNTLVFLSSLNGV
jgi:membrane protease YdiL (CAAX protease family)